MRGSRKLKLLGPIARKELVLERETRNFEILRTWEYLKGECSPYILNPLFVNHASLEEVAVAVLLCAANSR